MECNLEAPAQLDDMLHAGTATALRAWGADGPLRILPQALELATRGDGMPDFAFDMIRRDDRSAAPYALLNFRVQTRPVAPADLEALRAAAPRSTLQPLEFERGYLRLVPVGTDVVLPPAVTAPQPLAWNDLGRAGCRMRLDGEAAALTEALFRHAAIPLLAFVELEYSGMVPGVPLQVEFDPAQLLAALRGNGTGLVSRAVLLERLGAGHAALPLTVTGDPAPYPAATIAEALLARLRAELAQFAPAPAPGQLDFLQLADVPGGRMRWDLSEPCLGRRALCLMLEAFKSLERLGNPDAYLHRLSPPAPGFGGWRVDIAADLPPDLPVRFGVALRAPATALRDAIDTGIVELPAPGRAATATLRLAPGELPDFQVTTYCRWPGGTWEAAPAPLPAPANPARLVLAPEDFPARYARLALSGRLATQATVRCDAGGTAHGTPFGASVTLDAARPRATLCYPRGVDDGRLAVLATAADDAQAVARLTLPLRSVELDLPLFPGYGTQSVAVDCRFPDGATRPLLLEMADVASMTVVPLRLTPAHPSDSFSWWSASPFPPAYRWRRAGTGAWSAPLPAAQPLRLTLDNDVLSIDQPSPELLP